MDIRAFFSKSDVMIDVRASDKVQLLKNLGERGTQHHLEEDRRRTLARCHKR
jgi:hypothetical protein